MVANRRAYDLIWDLLHGMGGSEEWVPGGDPAGGGKWLLSLHHRLAVVPVHDRRINELDRLYVPKAEHPDPTEWDHYEHRLVDDAFWALVGLFGADG